MALGQHVIARTYIQTTVRCVVAMTVSRTRSNVGEMTYGPEGKPFSRLLFFLQIGKLPDIMDGKLHTKGGGP